MLRLRRPSRRSSSITCSACTGEPCRTPHTGGRCLPDVKPAWPVLGPTYPYREVGTEGALSNRIDAAYRRRCGWWKTRATLTTEDAVLGVTSRSVVLGRANRQGQWRAVGLSQPLSRAVSEELLDHVSATGELRELAGVATGLPGSEDVTLRCPRRGDR